MVLYRAEYMVGGTNKVAIESVFGPVKHHDYLFEQVIMVLYRAEYTLDGNLVGSTNHVFGPVKHHDYLFELPRMAREAGRPIKDSASSRNHWDVRTAPHANRAP